MQTKPHLPEQYRCISITLKHSLLALLFVTVLPVSGTVKTASAKNVKIMLRRAINIGSTSVELPRASAPLLKLRRFCLLSGKARIYTCPEIQF